MRGEVAFDLVEVELRCVVGHIAVTVTPPTFWPSW
jgi:hypothetical protein